MLPKLFSTKKCGLKLYLEKTPGGWTGWTGGGGKTEMRKFHSWMERNEDKAEEEPGHI